MVNDVNLRFIYRDSNGAVNMLCISDASTYSGETVSIGVEIIYNNTVYLISMGAISQGDFEYFSLPVSDGLIANGAYTIRVIFDDSVSLKVVTKNCVLNYTPISVQPYLKIDGYASVIYGYDNTQSSYTVKRVVTHRYPNGAVESKSVPYTIAPIRSGKHKITVAHEILQNSLNYEISDIITGEYEDYAYKLNYSDIFQSIIDYKDGYEREVSPAVKRQKGETIKQIDMLSSSYDRAVMQKNTYGAYSSLKSIYLLLNTNPIVVEEEIPVFNFSEFEHIHSVENIVGLDTLLSKKNDKVETIADVVVSQSGITLIEITKDSKGNNLSVPEGEELDITVSVMNIGGSRVLLTLNDLTSGYLVGNTYNYSSISLAASTYYGHYTNIKLRVIGGLLYGYEVVMPFNTASTLATTQIYAVSSIYSISTITKLRFTMQSGGTFPIGSRITVKRIKL